VAKLYDYSKKKGSSFHRTLAILSNTPPTTMVGGFLQILESRRAGRTTLPWRPLRCLPGVSFGGNR
jgi:hypothetical protein